MKRALCFLGLALFLVARAGRAGSGPPRVEGWVFYSKDCADCEFIDEAYLKKVEQQAGCILDLTRCDVADMTHYRTLLYLEKAYGRADNELPVIFIDGRFLSAETEIRRDLLGLVQKAAAAGGVTRPRVELAPIAGPTAGKTVFVAFFYRSSCEHCRRIFYALRYLKESYPFLVSETFDLTQQKNQELSEAVAERVGVPQEQRLADATVFVGKDFLLGADATQTNLERLVRKYALVGSECLWRVGEADIRAARARIVERFHNFGSLAVAVAGLVDGVNPCAFTVLVFFVSYLASLGRKGGEIVLVGAAFAVGVFVTYMAVGSGMLTFLLQLRGYARIAYWVRLAMGVFALCLGVLSAADFVKARRGDPASVSLKLPHFLKFRIQRAVSRGMRMRHYVFASLGVGFVVSLLELACTGQVYLPTIMYVTGDSSMRTRALAYLLLYNVMFILPLVGVFLLAFFGSGSQRLAAFARAHVGTVKLLLAGVFVGLGVLLLGQL